MNTERPSMLVPALVGGGLAGLFSAIPFLNCLCCLWIISGALLSSYLLAKDSKVNLGAGDGAIVGIFSGIVAAVVHAFVNIPFQAINIRFARRFFEVLGQYAENVPSNLNSWLEQRPGGLTPPLFFMGLLFSSVIFAAFGALGGVIGISLFGRKKTPSQQTATDVTQDTSHRQP